MITPSFQVEGLELPDKFNEVSSLKKRNGDPASVAQMVKHTRKRWEKSQDWHQVEYPARVYRKLMFLEYFFGAKVRPIETVNFHMVGLLDMVIRGILHGTIRQDIVRIRKRLKPASIDDMLAEFNYLVSRQDELSMCHLPFDINGSSVLTLGVWLPGFVIENRRELEFLLKKASPYTEVWFDLSIRKSLRVDFPYTPDELRANRRKMVEFIDELAKNEPRELAMQVLYPIYQECGGHRAVETAMAYVRGFRPLAPNESLTCWRHDLSDDGKTWVVQVAVILQSKQFAQLYLVFVDYRTGLVRTDFDAKSLPPGEILLGEKGGEEWGLPLFGES